MVSFLSIIIATAALAAIAQGTSAEISRNRVSNRGVARRAGFRHKRGSAKAQHCKTLTTSTSVVVATTTSAVTIKVQNEAGPAAVATHKTPTTSFTPKPTTKVTTSQTSQSSNTGGGDDGLTTSQEDQFLALHNSIRGQHGAGALTWNNTLAHIAKGWADRCVFQHSQGALGPFGENLAAGTGGVYDVAIAMKSWTDEESQYNPQNPQFSHYTQIVWKSTTQVGCGLAPACTGILGSDPAKYFVCEYHPPGNFIGEFGQNVQ